jgi:hypothetical protein
VDGFRCNVGRNSARAPKGNGNCVAGGPQPDQVLAEFMRRFTRGLDAQFTVSAARCGELWVKAQIGAVRCSTDAPLGLAVQPLDGPCRQVLSRA